MTRRQRRMLAGTPAVVALVGGVAVVAFLATRPTAARSGWYPAAADEAFDAQDYRTAAVCYTRALQTPPAKAGAVFNLALSLDRTGQPDAARGLLLRLAPANADGFPPAQLELVRLSLSADRPTAAAVDDADRRLAAVRRRSPDEPEVSYWAAVIAANRGQWDAADAAARRTDTLRPVLAERLARIATANGDAAHAERWAHDVGR